MSMKYSSDTIGNRTPDLPACNATPQPTAPPRAPIRTLNWLHTYLNTSWRAYTNYDDITSWYLYSSGMLLSVWWWFPIDVSGQPIGSRVQGSRNPSCPSSTSWLWRIYRRGCPETSIRNYHCLLRNIPKEGRSHILRGRNLRSHILGYGRVR